MLEVPDRGVVQGSVPLFNLPSFIPGWAPGTRGKYLTGTRPRFPLGIHAALYPQELGPQVHPTVYSVTRLFSFPSPGWRFGHLGPTFVAYLSRLLSRF